ncbi:MAG: cardiolipin synthase [Bacteroidota bacterium]|nr:cardiolipin synthase [Bacteroidota bacterium]
MNTWQAIWDFIKEWYWIPMLLIYAGIIITIVSENRNPSKSLAYILVLIFLPVIGLLVYYFVGRKPVFKKPIFDRKQLIDRIKMQQYYEQLKPQMEERLQLLEQDIGDMAFPFRYLYYQNQSLISTGNAVTLLNNGEEKFPALFKALENAQSHIHLEYYIFTADDVGNRIANILIKKHREGVEVRVIIDDAGSNHISNIPKKFKEAGIVLLKTMPVAFSSLANSNYRNHRKIVVIDGCVGFIGGINLDERYWNNGKHKLYWRDTAIRIEGPAVNLLQVQFQLSWFFAGGKDDFGEEGRYFKIPQEKKGKAVVAIAASGPSSEAPFIMEMIILAISQAKKTIRICTPYFIPPDPLTSALVIAAANGIKVELILPAKSDSFIVQHASFSFIKPLLERGVRVYLYEKGFIHAKTMSIDSSLAFVGTVNMDTRSFYLNFEITSIIYEATLCNALEDSFEQDKQSSRLVTLEGWQSRPAIQRGFDSVCRLVAPLL